MDWALFALGRLDQSLSSGIRSTMAGITNLQGLSLQNINSTPFVFFTGTFTGKYLCGGDVGWGHFLHILRQVFSQFST
jgi:hypothetical protein